MPHPGCRQSCGSATQATAGPPAAWLSSARLFWHLSHLFDSESRLLASPEVLYTLRYPTLSKRRSTLSASPCSSRLDSAAVVTQPSPSLDVALAGVGLEVDIDFGLSLRLNFIHLGLCPQQKAPRTPTNYGGIRVSHSFEAYDHAYPRQFQTRASPRH